MIRIVSSVFLPFAHSDVFCNLLFQWIIWEDLQTGGIN